MTNDVALLKLAGNGFNVEASDIELMCLPVDSDANYDQKECYVAGWGWTRKFQSTAKYGIILKASDMTKNLGQLWHAYIRNAGRF